MNNSPNYNKHAHVIAECILTVKNSKPSVLTVQILYLKLLLIQIQIGDIRWTSISQRININWIGNYILSPVSRFTH